MRAVAAALSQCGDWRIRADGFSIEALRRTVPGCHEDARLREMPSGLEGL